MKRQCPLNTKFKKFTRMMRWHEWQSMGILESLWHLTARETPRGDIGRLTNSDIACAIDYDDDANHLIAVLVEAGWLNVSAKYRLLVHDWHEHVDDTTKKFIERKGLGFATLDSDDTVRTNQYISATVDTTPQLSGVVAPCLEMSGQVSTSLEVSRNFCLPVPVPEPEPSICVTQGDAKKRKPSGPILDPERAAWFAEWYAAYPKHKDKEKGEIAFKKVITSRDLFDKAMLAVQKRLGTLDGPDPQFYPYPASWLNKKPWRDLEDTPMLPLYSGPHPNDIIR